MTLLDKINSPDDLKQFTAEELECLCNEIRTLLIDVTSKNGGHLAPNLGVVELTIALHKVFNTPKDKIVWDVGHQAYVHKILTGRKEAFATLRQYKGLSGFPKRQESPHDAFGTGHASTSISAALGMAAARDLKGEKYNVIAVIGDGALTGGMALEGLNNAGDLQKKLIVILNDNEMSIAKNVGAMSEYLYRIRTDPTYSKLKYDAESLLKSIPTIGEQVAKTANRLKDSLKYFLVPGMLFEDLGFTYMGPIDGQDIKAVEDVLETAKTIDKPVLVHIITKKGKGYLPAEISPNKFHGTGAFDIATGKKILVPNAPRTYTEVFSDTILELAENDDNLVAITAAMPDGTGLAPFAKKYPKRFFDVGIAEQHAVTMAAGMACDGIKPYVAIYSTFLQRSYDQVLHDVCMQNLHVVFCLDRAGLVGDDGYTHHGVFDYSYLSMMPNMTIMAPKDENELRHMLYTSTKLRGPVAIRYPRGSGLGVECNNALNTFLPIGKGEILREGKDVSIWAIGSMVKTACEVAEILAGVGIDANVINARFVKPLDEELLTEMAEKTKCIVTIEENILAGGFGSSILQHLNKLDMLTNTKVINFAIPDIFVPQGATKLLLQDMHLDSESISAIIQEKFKSKVK
ncbi:1-deoxy-D-xylulose-5-phosphate synthase [bioreactor metagenome]|uniref:1-deoxy-D-xylulose-5-phosphate synthase n=1 Tax=bioreactor metagenome TaxID=1076179 RepID=A0A644WD17_9ZZZZ|nr:1-deoxy-D-xylulose-5-phosphate synthase [Acidaminococcaceae bacterium]